MGLWQRPTSGHSQHCKRKMARGAGRRCVKCKMALHKRLQIQSGLWEYGNVPRHSQHCKRKMTRAAGRRCVKCETALHKRLQIKSARQRSAARAPRSTRPTVIFRSSPHYPHSLIVCSLCCYSVAAWRLVQSPAREELTAATRETWRLVKSPARH